MRIALAGISHEALPASPLRTRLTDFRVLRGRDALDAYASDLPNADLVPTLVAASTAPGGPIEQSVYTALRDEILEQLRTKGPFDGVCLSLHGAMWVEAIGSGEADLVRHIRETVGPQTLISASLDLHANISDTFARTVDIWTAYRTAPHRDTVETAQRALQLLISSLEANARPRPVFIRVPLLLQGEKATTDAEPMLTLEALARTTEQTPGILTAEVVVGFAWADTPDASSGITVIASSETSAETARTHAEHLAHEMWSRRTQFQFTREIAASADAALDIALAASESTVWLTDTGDNPTAGTPGDSTHFLHRLLVRQIPDAVFASIPDAASFQTCAAAGCRSEVRLSLGGHWDTTDSGPVELVGRVDHLSQEVATVRAGGTTILITRTRHVFATIGDFHRAGVDPMAHKIVVVKQGYLLPDLHSMAAREILVLTPGYSDMHLDRLPYHFLRRPIYPLDPNFAWQPN